MYLIYILDLTEIIEISDHFFTKSIPSRTSTQVESKCNDLVDLSQVEKNRLTPNTTYDTAYLAGGWRVQVCIFCYLFFIYLCGDYLVDNISKQIQMLFFDNYSEANEELWVELIPYDKWQVIVQLWR